MIYDEKLEVKRVIFKTTFLGLLFHQNWWSCQPLRTNRQPGFRNPT